MLVLPTTNHSESVPEYKTIHTRLLENKSFVVKCRRKSHNISLFYDKLSQFMCEDVTDFVLALLDISSILGVTVANEDGTDFLAVDLETEENLVSLIP